MCLIIDNCAIGDLLAQKPSKGATMIIDWLTSKGGMIVIGGKLTKELMKSNKPRRFIRSLRQAGRVIIIKDDLLDEDLKRLKKHNLKSNDSHVIALARVSGARTLNTGDRNLEIDFKNTKLINKPKGTIFKNHNHKALLKHTHSCIG